MKNILLDCGTHFGKGLRGQIQINNIDETWKIYAWEANPYSYQKFITNPRFSHLDITAYNAAVSNSNGTITLNIQDSTDRRTGESLKAGTGTSIVSLDEWRPAGGGDFVETAEVPTMDLSSWLSENVTEKDNVILKMDIEGAEYDVLEKVISDGNIKLIDRMYIEWHSSMFSDPTSYKEREDRILETFKQNNIEVHPW